MCCTVIRRSGSYPSCARQGSPSAAKAARRSPAPRIGPRVMFGLVMIFSSNPPTVLSTLRFPFRLD